MNYVKYNNLDNKVLFLGDNTKLTDYQVTKLAKEHNTINHGILTDYKCTLNEIGYYHTTVVDIPWGNLITLAQQFDLIVMLDQPQQQWTHWKCLQSTFKLMLKLEELGKSTIFRDNKNTKNIIYWYNLVYKENKSFCIYPWINFYDDGDNLKLCSRSVPTIATKDEFQDWATNPKYVAIRNKMLEGETLQDHCNVCYDYENSGIESYRQFETMDWVGRMALESIDDLSKIQKPYFYEAHVGNHCNIKCRGCDPSRSAPIGKEIKKFKLKVPFPMKWTPPTSASHLIDIDSLDGKKSVYFQGGEPTIMPEVLDFMKRCVEKKKTDFFLTMTTNGVKFSNEFLDVLSHFPNTNFSFSLDGYAKINDYWRSGSKWEKVIANAHMMKSKGHFISINTVPGIYNVTNLHLLFEFLDREFPFTAMYLQTNHNPMQSALNHPLKDLVLESMQKCMQTSVYHSNGKSCKSGIDSIYNYYSTSPVCDMEKLRNFFIYNDQLDRVRNTKLVDFIPELELARSYII
jgi:sulfatase maturation enzyme AslB (radical SAM superfamily)